MVSSLRGGKKGASGGWGPRKPRSVARLGPTAVPSVPGPTTVPSVPLPRSGSDGGDDCAVALKTSSSLSGGVPPLLPRTG
eukprot:8848422-Prorocentrum_lima.AAC.1